MLNDIVEKTSTGSKTKLHKALKRARGIDSLTSLSQQELYHYMIEIEAFFASEYGIEVLGDEEETLSEYFERTNNDSKQQRETKGREYF